MNRRLFLGGFIAAPAWSATPIRLSKYDGSPELISPADAKATVLLFLSTICPISNAYQDRIKALITATAGQPVRWLLINSNDNESAADSQQYARDVAFPVPLYKDWRNIVADRFGATMTPEAVLLDATGAIRYQGAFDDARNEARVKVPALKNAIDAVTAGRPVAIPALRAFGCAIKRVPKS